MANIALLCGCYSNDYAVIHTEVNDAESLYNISCEKMEYRDPFIYVDKEKQAYYCPVVAAEGIKLFKSRDLNMWRDLGTVYNYGGLYSDYTYWAADMYKWKDNVYCIATAVSKNGVADDFTSQKCNTVFIGNQYGRFVIRFHYIFLYAFVVGYDSVRILDSHSFAHSQEPFGKFPPFVAFVFQSINVDNQFLSIEESEQGQEDTSRYA